MKQRRTLHSRLLRLLMILGLGFYLSAGSLTVAFADDVTPTPDPTPIVTPTPEPSVVPTPDPTPVATPTPDPSVAPAPDPTPSTTPDPTPVATPAATPSPQVVATPVDPKTQCHGNIPRYAYNTATKLWEETDRSSFACTMPSALYLSPKYFFNTKTGWYLILPPDAPITPELLTAPNVVHTVLGDITVGSSDYQLANALGLLSAGPDGILASPGLSSSSVSGSGGIANANTNATGQTWLDLTNLVTVINALDSAAKTGDVNASGNTTVGNLSSGAATTIGNLVNLLAAAWSWSNGDLNYFMQNFFGDQTGNVVLNPTQNVTGSGGQLGSTATATNDLNVNAQSTGSIVNNVNLGAQSGNVGANSNSTVGNITSGSATAEANIVNLISSLINSGNSFFGILNLFGNLNGNILFPSGFLDGLIPSSTPAPTVVAPNSSAQSTTTTTNTANITNTATSTANNNITANAASGGVGVGSNTTAGSATSGAATTTQNLFNLANTSLFGDNAVLVIVNVLGHWVGKIMNLPGGASTSALLAGNATTTPMLPSVTGPNASATSTTDIANTANIDQTAVGTITNNINLDAKSGDVSANKNTSVGDATSGKATAISSVANIFNSVLNVKHWFGVLVINVFGDWFGSVDTAKPDVSLVQLSGRVTTTPTELPAPKLATPTSSTPKVTVATSGGSVAGTTITKKKIAIAAAQTPDKAIAAAKGSGLNLLLVISAFVMLLAGALFSLERKLTDPRKSR